MQPANDGTNKYWDFYSAHFFLRFCRSQYTIKMSSIVWFFNRQPEWSRPCKCGLVFPNSEERVPCECDQMRRNGIRGRDSSNRHNHLSKHWTN